MITAESIDRIMNIVQIEEVVSDFVRLKKRGVNMLGLCPFHDEKTPSFTVSPAKGIFKCFGCGKAGNAVGFVMEHEKLSYPEALRYLADKYNIEIEETAPTEKYDPETKSARESLYIVLAAAQKYFTEQLNDSEEGKTIAQPYLKERGIKAEMAERFQLGWSLTSRDAFSKWAIQNGYQKEFLLSSGMSLEGREGDLFDRFHERLIFPIHNISGKVVGFGGRIMRSNTKDAKYINSPETDVYNKSQVLYGLYQAKKAIRQTDKCILVEGYTDVISMHQAGIENVAASSGTSLTEDHLRLVKRFTDNAIFLFDGDAAGQKASARAMDMALAQGINAKVVMLPQEHDPDSFAKAFDREEIEAYLAENSLHFVQFKTKLLGDTTQKDPVEKARAVKELLQSVLLIHDPIQQAFYIREIEKSLEVEEKLLYDELRRLKIGQLKDKNKPFEPELNPLPRPIDKPPVIRVTAEKQEIQIIKLLVLYGDRPYDEERNVAMYIIQELHEVSWENPVAQSIFNAYMQQLTENSETPDFKTFLNSESPEQQQFITELITERYGLSANWKNFLGRGVAAPNDNYKPEIDSAMHHFKLRKVVKMLDENQKDLLKATTGEELEQLQAVHIQLSNMKMQIMKEMGATLI